MRREVDEIVIYYDYNDATQGMHLNRLPRVSTLSSPERIDEFLRALRERRASMPNIGVGRANPYSNPNLYIVAHDQAHHCDGFIRYDIISTDDGLLGLVFPNGGDAVRQNGAVLDWLKKTAPAVYEDCVRRAQTAR